MSEAVRLPDGRRLALGADVADRLHCGVLVSEAAVIAPAAGLVAETEACAQRLREEYAGHRPADIPSLREARRLYRSLGMEPTRHRPSSEALLRRVLKGRALYRINNAVDACNLASLSFLLPIGLYDLDRVVGDVTLRLGRPGEGYAGIRKGPVHLSGRLGLFDDKGPFGSPTSDSARTCVGETTRRLLAVVMATAGYAPAALSSHLDLLADLFVRHGAGTVTWRASLPAQASP